jgi:hypothetical protein
MAVIAMSGGMMDFMYQTSKALVLAWKVVPPPEGGGLSFSGRREDTDEVLERDAYPIELLHDLLATWLYEGRPRAPHSRMPPQHYQWPLQLLINGAERFVVAHEYGHALMDQLSRSGQDESAKNPDAELSDWERELRADSFAVMVVVESSRVLDLLPPNMALQGAIVAMKAHQIFDRALSTVQHGRALPDDGSPTHPPFERRIAQLEALYLQHHPDSERAREDLRGMLVPSQTIEQLWTRVAPRLASNASSGRALHPVWSRKASEALLSGTIPEWHQAVLSSVERRLGSTGQVELAEHVAHVDADGLLGNPKLARNLAIGQPTRHQGQHLLLALGQPLWCLGRARRYPEQMAGGSRVQVWLAAVHRADRPRQLLDVDVLQQVALRSRLYRAMDQVRLGEGGQRDDRKLRMLPLDRLDRRHSVQLWHHQVHQDQVGLLRLDDLNRFATVSRLADQLHVRQDLHHGDEALPGDRVVVHDHDSYRCHQFPSVARSTRGRATRRRSRSLRPGPSAA